MYCMLTSGIFSVKQEDIVEDDAISIRFPEKTAGNIVHVSHTPGYTITLKNVVITVCKKQGIYLYTVDYIIGLLK